MPLLGDSTGAQASYHVDAKYQEIILLLSTAHIDTSQSTTVLSYVPHTELVYITKQLLAVLNTILYL